MGETGGLVAMSPNGGTDRKTARPARPVFEVFLCVVGSLLSIMSVSVSTLLMVYGSWLLCRKEEGRSAWALAGCLVPGVALSFVSWDLGSLVLPCAVTALVVAMLLPGRVNITTACLAMLGSTVLLVAADASLVMLWGESFAAYVQALLDEIREVVTASLTAGTSSVYVQATVDATVELLGKVWPLLYISRGVAAVLAGLLGLMLARRDTYQKVYRAFTRFDIPLWGVVALVVAVVCLAVQPYAGSFAPVAEAIALNVLLCLRALFFLQGLAVGMYLMDSRSWGPMSRVLVLSFMLMAELGLFAVCVFGVIDVWANFRKLVRPERGQTTGEGE